MKKMLVLIVIVAMSLVLAHSASASPIGINNLEWTMFGDDVFVVDNAVIIQEGTGTHNQEMDTYGAEFSIDGLLGFGFETELSSWDSTWYDEFSVTATQGGQTETLWSWGGDSWTDRVEEFDQGFYSLVLPDYFLSDSGETTTISFQLTTRWDQLYSSQGTFALTSVNTDSVAPVPEPATFMLMAAGLGGLGIIRRRKKSA